MVPYVPSKDKAEGDISCTFLREFNNRPKTDDTDPATVSSTLPMAAVSFSTSEKETSSFFFAN